MIPAAKTAPKKLLLRALEGELTEKTPFWLMRQAGRYLPEYRALREKAGSFLNLCYTPDMACEVTLQPLRRFGMDAAILFSDILVVPQALGQDLSFVEGEGPKLGALNLETLSPAGLEERLGPVYEALKLVRRGIPPDKAVIGFAGAPFTLACYMVCGQGDGKFDKAVAAAKAQDVEFTELIALLTDAVAAHLSAQIRAGAEAVQLFDSWAGLLQGQDFERWVIEPAAKIAAFLRKAHPQAPLIGFPRGAGKLYPLYADKTGVHALGVDQDTTLDWVAGNVRRSVCLQGNLAPEALLAGGARLEKEANSILDAMAGRPFVFNLGHGVIKETPPEHVAALAKIILVHRQ